MGYVPPETLPFFPSAKEAQLMIPAVGGMRTEDGELPCCNCLKESGLQSEPGSKHSGCAQDPAGLLLTPGELQEGSLVHTSKVW